MSNVVIPVTGEALALDGPLQTFAAAWDSLLEVEQEIRTAKREISDEIARRLDHEGKRTLHVEGVKFEVNAPEERQWNLAELQLTLAELITEGTISAEKAERCIRWKPEAAWSEIKTLLSDPRCRARIEHCFEMAPATRYARVTR
jgi:hypothetical protein